MLDTTFLPAICPRLHAISLLLANDPPLLRILFDPGSDVLRSSPAEIIASVGGYSSGQQLLTQIALDIWSEHGCWRLWDAISVLDPLRFEGFMLALECLRGGTRGR